MRLYDYFIFKLTEANKMKSADPIQEILPMLTDLREAWVGAAKIVNGVASVAGS
jgi:flagellin-specific chaperone FliS